MRPYSEVMDRTPLEDGKYEIIRTVTYQTYAMRYGEFWQDLTGNKMINAMINRIKELEENGHN